MIVPGMLVQFSPALYRAGVRRRRGQRRARYFAHLQLRARVRRDVRARRRRHRILMRRLGQAVRQDKDRVPHLFEIPRGADRPADHLPWGI